MLSTSDCEIVGIFVDVVLAAEPLSEVQGWSQVRTVVLMTTLHKPAFTLRNVT
jgi:hypothetical protein